jgi:hypothetical protein
MDHSFEIESRRFLWVAALTIFVSILAVMGVRAVAVRILHPDPAFLPLTVEPPIMDTIMGAVAAIFAFIMIASYPNPARIYRRVAGVALIVSFVPDVILAESRAMGGGWPEAYALMIMHVVVCLVCITILPSLGLTRVAETRASRDQPLSIL